MKEKETISDEKTGYRPYLAVWAALLALTGITVYVAGIDLGRYGIIVNILIASVKASLVVYIFMHLKHESRMLKAMLFFVLSTLTVTIVLTFMDVLYRY